MDKIAQQLHPQVPGTFLNRLATNLPPAIAGGAGSSTFAGGLSGGFQGIQEQQRYQQQQADLQQQRSLQMQQFQNQQSQFQAQQANANRDYQLSLQRENRLAATPDNKTLVRPPAGVAGPIQAFDPVKGTLSLVSSPYQQGAGPLASQGMAWQNAAPPKYIGSYTNAENKRVNQYQTPDGSMQETVGDEVYHAPTGTANADDRRLDQSYQFNVGQLNKVRQPVDQQLDRLNRVVTSLNQNSPQADALIAPELLTAMAGGQGSGLRMNEAEISRIVGGRNAWQSLKASVDRWQSDPSKPFLLTPEQRKQTKSLIDAMYNRLSMKQSAFDDAQQALIKAPNVESHRQIVADAQAKANKFDLVTDEGTQGNPGGASAPISLELRSGTKVNIP